MKHVIIGAGAAGVTAAKTIRGLRPDDEIVLLSEDGQASSRCMLHRYISGERDAEGLRFVPADFFEKNCVEWKKDCRVTGVDTKAKTLQCTAGNIAYDKLLVATGAQSIIPPVGALRSAKNVFGLRHLSDAEAIRLAADKAARAVIVGAGLVGLDAAYALMERKIDVTVVDIADGILAVNLDGRAAQAYRERFEAAGCKLCLGRKAVGTEEDGGGNVVRLALDDGTVLPCDFLVVAAGVRPAVAFLEGSGIAFDRAVTVDRYLASSCPDVYAAGDAAGLSGIWPNAARQGEIAAKNMCGLAEEYTDTFAVKNTVNFFGLLTLSAGILAPGEGDSVLVREDRGTYRKLILREGCVAGVVLQGDISGSGFWQYLIKNKIRVDKIKKPLWKLSFADFYGIDERGEYLWTADAV